MRNLPAGYEWLETIGGPKIVEAALNYFDVAEIVGPKHNPVIMGWLKRLGLDWINDDETPWCGTFMGICALEAGKPASKECPRAKWWLNWGTYVSPGKEMFGDVLIFDRQGGGHVGLYVGEDATCFHVLGGNQANRVCIVRIRKTQLVGARRCKWSNQQPAQVKKVYLKVSGAPTGASLA